MNVNFNYMIMDSFKLYRVFISIHILLVSFRKRITLHMQLSELDNVSF